MLLWQAHSETCTKIYEFKTILEGRSNKEILSWIGLIILLRSSHTFVCILSNIFCEIRFSDTYLYILFRYFIISLVFLRFTVAREAVSSILSTLFARIRIAFSFYKRCLLVMKCIRTHIQTHTHTVYTAYTICCYRDFQRRLKKKKSDNSSAK